MIRARVGRLVAVAVCAGMLTTPARSLNLVNNGGFESGLTGWTTNNFILQGFDFGIDSIAHSGSSAFFGGAVGDLGFLSQTITTVPGTSYLLTFWTMSSGFFENEFQASINGSVRLDEMDVPIGGYARQTLVFEATGASTTLQFGFRDDGFAFHFDDVSVAVPEPASLPLLAIGLAGVALARRRKT